MIRLGIEDLKFKIKGEGWEVKIISRYIKSRFVFGVFDRNFEFGRKWDSNFSFLILIAMNNVCSLLSNRKLF